jgi:hypothetical protein
MLTVLRWLFVTANSMKLLVVSSDWARYALALLPLAIDHNCTPTVATMARITTRLPAAAFAIIRSLPEASFALSLPSILPVAKDLDRSAE